MRIEKRAMIGEDETIKRMTWIDEVDETTILIGEDETLM